MRKARILEVIIIALAGMWVGILLGSFAGPLKPTPNYSALCEDALTSRQMVQMSLATIYYDNPPIRGHLEAWLARIEQEIQQFCWRRIKE